MSKSEWRDRFFYHPTTRRHFMKLTSSVMVGLPALEIFKTQQAHAQTNPEIGSCLYFPFMQASKIPFWWWGYPGNGSNYHSSEKFYWEKLSAAGHSGSIFHPSNCSNYEILRRNAVVIPNVTGNIYARGHDHKLTANLGDYTATELTNKSRDNGTIDWAIKDALKQKYNLNLNMGWRSFGSGMWGPYAAESTRVSSKPPGGTLMNANFDLRNIASGLVFNNPPNGGTPVPTSTPTSPAGGGGAGNVRYNRTDFFKQVPSMFSGFSGYLKSIGAKKDANHLDLFASIFHDFSSKMEMKVNTMAQNLSIPVVPTVLGNALGIDKLVSLSDRLEWIRLLAKLTAYEMYLKRGFYQLGGFNAWDEFGNAFQNLHDDSHFANAHTNLSEGMKHFSYLKLVINQFIVPMFEQFEEIAQFDPSVRELMAVVLCSEHGTGAFHQSSSSGYELSQSCAGKMTMIFNGKYGGHMLNPGKTDLTTGNQSVPISLIWNGICKNIFKMDPSSIANDDLTGTKTFGLVDANCHAVCGEWGGGKHENWNKYLGDSVFRLLNLIV